MKITYPVFKPSIEKTQNPLVYIVELVYHTVLPCAVTYLAIKNNMPLMLIFILIPLFFRIRPEMINREL